MKILIDFVEYVWELIKNFLKFFKISINFIYYVIFYKKNDKKEIKGYDPGKGRSVTIYENKILSYKEKIKRMSIFLIETPIKLFLIGLIFYIFYHLISLIEFIKLFPK